VDLQHGVISNYHKNSSWQTADKNASKERLQIGRRDTGLYDGNVAFEIAPGAKNG
jgi:hypothetical protein